MSASTTRRSSPASRRGTTWRTSSAQSAASSTPKSQSSTTEELLAAYRGKALDWPAYEQRYEETLRQRKVEDALDRSLFEPGIILLCSEDKPDRCHRRLAAEYLRNSWPDVKIRHL